MRRTRGARGAIATAALFAAVVGCGSKAGESGKADGGGGGSAGGGKGGKGGRGGLMFAVDVMPVEANKVDYVITAPGTIDAFERVQVTARVAGAVDRVMFSEGQNVKQGQPLVVIDSERYQLAVNGAKAALEKMQAAQADTEAMEARRASASSEHPGLITGEELATFKTKTLTAKADTQVASEALKTAQLNLRDSTVHAPMEGVVQTRTVETGQYVQPGYVMATLLRSDPMLLRFQVEPPEAPRLKPGMIASFSMRETQRTYQAKISLVAAAADVTTHMVSVTAELTEKEHKYWLRPGSFCDVSVEIPSGDRVAPVIPRLAARATDHGYVAYVIEGDVAHERALTLGMNTKDGWVEVRSGIAAGDLLVVHGAEALSDGAKVKATHTTAAALMNQSDGGAPAGTHAIEGGAPPATSAPADGPHDAGRHRK